MICKADKCIGPPAQSPHLAPFTKGPHAIVHAGFRLASVAMDIPAGARMEGMVAMREPMVIVATVTLACTRTAAIRRPVGTMAHAEITITQVMEVGTMALVMALVMALAMVIPACIRTAALHRIVVTMAPVGATLPRISVV